MTKNVQELFHFIKNSPTAYHAAETMRRMLMDAGYTQLFEGEAWELLPDGKYFVIRNHSALIAFRMPQQGVIPQGFQMIATHDDSPLFKIKENPELEAEGHYVKLNVEKYGGMLCAPWFDRPLSCAGRLIVRTENGIAVKLVDAQRPMLMIPNLAIHMNREANDGMKYNVQKDMLPIYGDETAKGTFMKTMAELAGVDACDVLGHDLYVYNCMEGTVWGAHDEYLSMARLDDLECAFASLMGFLKSGSAESQTGTAANGSGVSADIGASACKTASIPVHCVFDNEEVGSGTRQGAASTFLADTLQRIAESIGVGVSGYRRMIANSFMISADNAHAVHPNYPEKADPVNRPYMNGGIVVKFSANQKYTTDGVSAAIFRTFLQRAGVGCQTFFNRSDMIGGSTLGNISIAQVAVNCVDIGLAQLAMHSPYETAGVRDLDDLITVAEAFYRSSIRETGHGTYSL